MLSFLLSLVETPQEQLLIEKLYKQYKQDMYRTAFAILKKKTDAEDAVADAFMRIIKNIAKIDADNPSRTKAFMLIITKNAAITKYGKIKKEYETTKSIYELSEDIIDEDIDINPLSHVNTKHIFNLVKTIGDDFYDIMFLKYNYGYTLSEISDIIGLSENNIRQIQARGKRELVAKMEKDGITQ